MDLYSTSAGSISQGNVRRRGVESAHASQRARIQDIGKNWSENSVKSKTRSVMLSLSHLCPRKSNHFKNGRKVV